MFEKIIRKIDGDVKIVIMAMVILTLIGTVLAEYVHWAFGMLTIYIATVYLIISFFFAIRRWIRGRKNR